MKVDADFRKDCKKSSVPLTRTPTHNVKKVRSSSQFAVNTASSSRPKEKSASRKNKSLVRDGSVSDQDLSTGRAKQKQSKRRIVNKNLASLKLAADGEKTPKNLKEET